MVKYIGGKKYDTATATLILSTWNGVRSTQRDYYITKKGAFFCHYVRVNDIHTIPEDTMKDILLANNVEKYIELFGEEGIEEG